MARFTLLCHCVLIGLCVVAVLGKPTKHKSSHKAKKETNLANKDKTLAKKEKRWDLIVSDDPNLTKELPSNCQDIINEYSNGRILMYEYKIQMGRCMKKAKADAEATAEGEVKSALARPSYNDDNTNIYPTEPEKDFYSTNTNPANEGEFNDNHDNDYDSNSEELSDSDRRNDNVKDNDDSDDDDDDDDEPDEAREKKMQVPVGYQTPFNTQAFNMPVQPQGMPGQQAAPFYPNAAQAPVNPAPVQNQVPDQTQAAFAPSPMNQYPANPAPFQPAQPNMGMNTVARTNIPENAQPQPPASQANAVFDQWRASSFGAKKDETPGAPNAPSNDQFADFMKMQSTSPEAAAPSQQAVMPAVVQQRSDIQQQPNMFDTQPQVPAPAQGQAFLTQPQAPFPGQGF